jgi:hypothetical protein
MAGNIAYITLGGYLNEQPGVITSLTFDIPEEAPWEIGIDDAGNDLSTKDIRQVPHMIKVTGIKFIPIHKFRPEKQSFRNDILGTDSTRLLNTGKQRYVDQLRPEVTNYDEEAQTTYKNNKKGIKLDKIPVQPLSNSNTLLQQPQTSLAATVPTQEQSQVQSNIIPPFI